MPTTRRALSENEDMDASQPLKRSSDAAAAALERVEGGLVPVRVEPLVPLRGLPAVPQLLRGRPRPQCLSSRRRSLSSTRKSMGESGHEAAQPGANIVPAWPYGPQRAG